MSAENGQGTATRAVARRPDRTPLSQRDPMSIAKAFAASRFFGDTLRTEQAVVKIVAGEELGLGPWAAIQGITIIEGKLGMTANLMATLVAKSGTHRYRVLETTNEKCSLEFFAIGEDGDESLGVSEFEVADADRAGLLKPKSNWEKWPRAMCFARALTQGVRMYCPEVTAGTPAYTPEELGATVNEAGEIIEEPDVLDGEIVPDQPTTGQVDDAAQDAEPVIGPDRAAEIYEAATSVEQIEPGPFAQAVSFVMERPAGDLTTQESAVAVLAGLTEGQADLVVQWIDRQKPQTEQAEGEEATNE